MAPTGSAGQGSSSCAWLPDGPGEDSAVNPVSPTGALSPGRFCPTNSLSPSQRRTGQEGMMSWLVPFAFTLRCCLHEAVWNCSPSQGSELHPPRASSPPHSQGGLNPPLSSPVCSWGQPTPHFQGYRVLQPPLSWPVPTTQDPLDISLHGNEPCPTAISVETRDLTPTPPHLAPPISMETRSPYPSISTTRSTPTLPPSTWIRGVSHPRLPLLWLLPSPGHPRPLSLHGDRSPTPSPWILYPSTARSP